MRIALEVPPLPAAHGRALSLLSDPDFQFEELAMVIESDPALTMSLLRAANSAASAPVARVDTASVAIVRVGTDQTRRLVVGAVASSAFAHLHRAEIDSGEIWQHLIAVAMLAQAVAWLHGTPTGEVGDAFTAGMLHDLGRLSMAAQEPERYATVSRQARDGENVREAERDSFGFEHGEWGMQVAEQWDLSDGIGDAIAHHHDVSRGRFAESVCIAREIAWSMGIGDGLTDGVPPTFPLRPEHETIVSQLGGPEGLIAQIEWYRGAIGGA